ncbi:MAG: Abi family protein [Gammaproteobacteria bacterium]|nr:Abi family protein [Gammaproteobacteria bacterium]NNJ84446.1 Abi family protein [Gammaproteobacteria bacterium]
MALFNKPAYTIDQHLALLQQRGMEIPDEPRAQHYLANIGYYRLSAYTRTFYQPGSDEHRFVPGTCFDHILDLYVFDRELRLLLLDAIERIEIALRAQLASTFAEHYGPHGYLNPDLFNTRYRHDWLIDKLNSEVQSRQFETFLAHYRRKYTAAPPQPPIWMAVELLSFKEISTLFANLRQPQDTGRIEVHFGWKFPVLRSWFRSLSDLRNLCAHHVRVWNREFGSRPEMPRKTQRPWPQIPIAIPTGAHTRPEQRINPRRRLYAQLAVIESLIQVACPDSRWAIRLGELLDRHTGPSRPHMGFPSGWEQDPFWQAALTSEGKRP